jgi:hypothetical protein
VLFTIYLFVILNFLLIQKEEEEEEKKDLLIGQENFKQN